MKETPHVLKLIEPYVALCSSLQLFENKVLKKNT